MSRLKALVATSALLMSLLIIGAQCSNGNFGPAAIFSASPTWGVSPLTVTFDASASFDIDGTITSYVWDYGDRTSSEGAITSHIFISASDRTYTVTLTVADNGEKHATCSEVITLVGADSVGRPPSIGLTATFERTVPMIVDFNGFFFSCSECDKLGVRFIWDFGDGDQEACTYCYFATHQYDNLGPYEVRATITDDYGRTGMDSVIVNGHPLPPDAILIDETTSGTIAMDVGQTLVVYLRGTPMATGYVWGWRDSLLETVLKPAGERYVPDITDEPIPPGGDVGSFEFRFEGVAHGTTPLEFVQWQPWTVQPDWTHFGVTVVVR